MDIVVLVIPYTSPTICKKIPLPIRAKATATLVSKGIVNMKWVCLRCKYLFDTKLKSIEIQHGALPKHFFRV